MKNTQIQYQVCYKISHLILEHAFTELISGSFGNVPVKKNQTLCVSYYTSFIMGSLCNKQVNKIRHYVLAD